MAKKAATTIKLSGRSVSRFDEGGGVVMVDVVIDGPGGTLRSSETFAFDGDEPTDEQIIAEINAR